MCVRSLFCLPSFFIPLSCGLRAVPFLLDGYHFKEQDLKTKYGAEWALVTGSSSGIGRALTTKLAKQGINVVMVAIDDKLLTDVHAQMQKESVEHTRTEAGTPRSRVLGRLCVKPMELGLIVLFLFVYCSCVLLYLPLASPTFSSARLA
jgi:hypothetical protein